MLKQLLAFLFRLIFKVLIGLALLISYIASGGYLLFQTDCPGWLTALVYIPLGFTLLRFFKHALVVGFFIPGGGAISSAMNTLAGAVATDLVKESIHDSLFKRHQKSLFNSATVILAILAIVLNTSFHGHSSDLPSNVMASTDSAPNANEQPSSNSSDNTGDSNVTNGPSSADSNGNDSTNPSGDAVQFAGYINDVVGDGTTIQLPVYGVIAQHGLEQADNITPTGPMPTLSFDIPQDQWGELAIYWMNLGGKEGFTDGLRFLAPKGWSVKNALVAVDGGRGLTLVNPGDPQQTFSYEDDGPSFAADVQKIGTYFPELDGWASQQGFPTGPPLKYIASDLMNSHVMMYDRNDASTPYTVSGIAYQDHPSQQLDFRNVEIAMPDQEHALKTSVLNYALQYLIPSN